MSAPVRQLAKLPQPPSYTVHDVLPVRRIPKRNLGASVDTAEQNTSMVPGINYSLGLDFLGVGNGLPGYTVPCPSRSELGSGRHPNRPVGQRLIRDL